MRDLTLSISAGGTTYTYQNDQLTVGVGTVDAEVNDLDVDLEDIPVTVQGDLAGYSDGLSLPDELWRAKLEDGTSTTLLDGAILTSDVDYRKKKQQFQLRVIDQAPRTVEETLKRSYFETPTKTLPTISVLEGVLTKDDGIVTETVDVHRLREVLVGVMDYHGWSYSLPDPLWFYEVEYASISETRTSSDVVMEVAYHEHSTIVQAICQLAGFRLIASYDGFPAKDITIDFQKTDWPAPSTSDTLDEKGAAETIQGIQRGGGQWGLTTSRGADVASDNPIDANYDIEIATPGAYPPLYAAVPHEAPWSTEPARRVYQSENARDLRDERNILANLANSKIDFIPVAVRDMQVQNAYREYEVRGPAYAPKDPDFSTVSIGELASNDNQLIWGLHPNEKEFESDIFSPAHAAHWPDAPYTQQQQRRTTWREVEGPFFDAADLQLGDREALYDYEGRKWISWESRRDIDRKISELRIRTPTDLTTKPARPDSPPSDWYVLQPEAELRQIDRGNGLEEIMLVSWEPTPSQVAGEVWYEIQIDNTNGTEGYLRNGVVVPPSIVRGKPQLSSDALSGDTSIEVECTSNQEVYLERGHVIYLSDPFDRYKVASPIRIDSGERKDIQLQSSLNKDYKVSSASGSFASTAAQAAIGSDSDGDYNQKGDSEVAIEGDGSGDRVTVEPGDDIYFEDDSSDIYTADEYVNQKPLTFEKLSLKGTLNRTLNQTTEEQMFKRKGKDQILKVERSRRRNRGVIKAANNTNSGDTSVTVFTNDPFGLFYVDVADSFYYADDPTDVYRADEQAEIFRKFQAGDEQVTFQIKTQLNRDITQGTKVVVPTEDPPFRTYGTALAIQYMPPHDLTVDEAYTKNINVRIRPVKSIGVKGDWKTITPERTSLA